MKVFLTGATGFVGYHVAKALAAEGADLLMLVRKTSNLSNLEDIPGETHMGDLAEPESIRPALAGCDAVVHVAADYRLWIRDPEAMYRANVDGTRDLLRMAREADVRRFVHTSSVATMHFRTDGLVINEDTPVSLRDMVGHYKRSKFMAEQHAIARRGRWPTCGYPQPHDADWTERCQAHADGPHLCRLSEGQIPRVHGHRAQPGGCDGSCPGARGGAHHGEAGKRYILGGENLTLKQILDKMSAITGIPSPTMKIPFAVAATYAFFEEWITGRMRGREPRATLEEVRMGRKKMYASSAHAQQELGFRILPVYPAMRAAIEWFRANGYA